MTFEEFFKKKRIDLDSFSKADPVLLAEFRNHFEQMGEKSFDHTKKYWFNKLRHQYHLAPESKTEKPHIANPLAEQTITESLSENAPVSSAPKMGFTPKFRAGATSTTAAKPGDTPAATEAKKENIGPETSPTPKVGFTPRFKAGTTKAAATESEEKTPPNEQPAAPASPSKVGFTPRFKAGTTKAAATESEEKTPPSEQSPASASPSKVGFTPRFKAGVTKPASEPQPEETQQQATETIQPEPVAKPAGFTPRFKAGVTKPATTEPKIETSPAVNPEIKEEEVKAKENVTPSASTPKPGFTPRFKAGVTKQVTAINADPMPEAITENKKDDTLPSSPEPTEEVSKEPVSKPAGFNPRFKAKPKGE